LDSDRWRRPVDYDVRPSLQPNQRQRENRQSYLDSFGTALVLLTSRLRHCAEGRDRNHHIQASTSRLATAPMVAKASMGMRNLSS
jgi:hypothetical protein